MKEVTETYKLLDQLSSKPKNEIQNALIALMLTGKVDYADVSKSYVECLKNSNDNNSKILAEAGTCILDSLFIAHQKKKLKVIENNIVQRNLYFLNNIYRGFNMDKINKDLKYIGNNEAKKLSYYANNK